MHAVTARLLGGQPLPYSSKCGCATLDCSAADEHKTTAVDYARKNAGKNEGREKGDKALELAHSDSIQTQANLFCSLGPRPTHVESHRITTQASWSRLEDGNRRAESAVIGRVEKEKVKDLRYCCAIRPLHVRGRMPLHPIHNAQEVRVE